MNFTIIVLLIFVSIIFSLAIGMCWGLKQVFDIVNGLTKVVKSNPQKIINNTFTKTEYLNAYPKKQYDWSKEEPIIFSTFEGALDVLEKMFKLMNDYGTVSVCDYKELSGIISCYVENGYGWTPEILNLTDPDCPMVKGVSKGYTIILPDPIKLK